MAGLLDESCPYEDRSLSIASLLPICHTSPIVVNRGGGGGEGAMTPFTNTPTGLMECFSLFPEPRATLLDRRGPSEAQILQRLPEAHRGQLCSSL